jgi:xylulokinase
MKKYVPRKGCCMGPTTGGDEYYQISFCSPGTSAMDDYRREHACEVPYEELLRSAEAVEPGAGGLTAELAGGAVRFDGENGKQGPGNYVRAIMELTGRKTASLINDLGMDNAFRAHPVILAVGGGARSDLWMRVVADVAGIEVVRASPADTASKGAAMLSAVGLGWFKDVAACINQWCRIKETE